MFLFADQFPDYGPFSLGTDEAHHATNVLRMKVGDSVFLLDGRGRKARAEILEVHKREMVLHILQIDMAGQVNPSLFSLAVCPTKNIDRMEWLVEKAVEAGASDLFFIQSNRTERGRINMERLQKIARAALKQSGRMWMTNLHEIESFREHIKRDQKRDNAWIAYCGDGAKTSLQEATKLPGRHHILIGPEGDFHPDEIELAWDNGYRDLSLGETRLRTETAALLVSFAFSDCLR